MLKCCKEEAVQLVKKKSMSEICRKRRVEIKNKQLKEK
jgi:hypothetical protein